MKVPFVHSNFARVEGDYYPTIDKRCVYGFLQYFKPIGLCIDVCAPDGSGIVDTLRECRYRAVCFDDAYGRIPFDTEWVITNPPYDRALVDKIIYYQIDRVRLTEIRGFAALLRSNFDFAKSRRNMFQENPFYYGQVKLLFRPWWSEDRTAQPIHNYVWHIWIDHEPGLPKIFYADGVL